MKKLLQVLLPGALALTAAHARADTNLTIATVNNGDMIIMEKLTPEFEASHPGIHLTWVVLEENILRQRVTTDIATKGGQFDVVTIGYETPMWARAGWILPITPPPSYDLADILGTVREAVSSNGQVYALPFYGESGMTYYRKDLFEKAGLKMPAKPTYDEIRQFADKLTDRAHGVYGICLRGKPGWGENMGYLGTLVNTFGGQYFDMHWQPTIDTPPWHAAVNWYVDTLRKDGPPGATSNGFNENLALFSTGHCGIWVDSTVAAGQLYDPGKSQVAHDVAFAPMPTGPWGKGPTWLWSWNLAIPSSTKHADAAKQFVEWATSKDYIKLVGSKFGWISVPPGTRNWTYKQPQYQAAAPFAAFVEQAILDADPNGPTAQPRPYHGANFVDIMEFQSIGQQMGQLMASALDGRISVDAALSQSQAATTQIMQESGANSN